MQHLKKPVGQSFAKAPSMQPAPSIAGRYTFDSLVTKTGLRDAGQGHFELEREKLLQINLTEECSWVWIKIGSMVARTGKITFRRQGAIEQGLKKLMMKTLTGEGVKLVKAEGVGKVFCADSGKTISVVQLDGESLYVNGNDVLAISASLKYDITLMKGAGALAGGFFNVRVEGHGMVAFTCHGSVVTLQATEDHPVFTDPNATVAWTHNPQLKFDITAKAVITGRGSGEEFQLRFSEGYVIIQPYEEISPFQAL